MSDTAFEPGDEIGVYVVNFSSSGDPGSLSVSGNHVDNLKFSYDGNVWTPETQCYWADETTPADFYAYCPYDGAQGDVSAYPVSVAADQSDAAAFKSSYFLWGKASGVSPTPSPVSISLRHSMSCLIVRIVADEGFTDEDVESATVSICNLKTEGSVNLATGEVTASAGIVELVPFKESSGQYRALLLPQTVTDVNLVKILVEGRELYLNQSITLQSGKQHTCTITLKKTAQGLNVGLVGWDQDEIDYGGIVG